MRWFGWWLLVLLLVVPVAAGAQGTNAWEVVVYAPGESAPPTFYVLTANGVSEQYVIPPEAIQGSEDAFVNAVLSADRRYAAVSVSAESEAGAPPIAIANVQEGTCCTYVAPPTDKVDTYGLGRFSPDGTRLAFAYLNYTSDWSNQEAGMVIADTATGAILSMMPLSAVNLAFPELAVPYVQIEAWNGDEIYFIPTCWACEGTVESPYYLWDLQTGEIRQAGGTYFTAFGDRLELTGELVYTIQNPMFPWSDEPSYFPPPNVVEYYSNGVPVIDRERPADFVAPVIFFDGSNLYLPYAKWVIDGQAFLLESTEFLPQGVVLFRDGRRVNVPMPVEERYLSGTPDGFLTQHEQDDTIRYYRWDGGVWNVTQLAQPDGWVNVLSRTPLGATVAQPFPLLDLSNIPGVMTPQPTNATTTQSCPGFLPSRLVAGGIGRVTPGTPNRLRSTPATSGAIVGQIPGGDAFRVINGPECDPAGIAWWQVEYNGLVGWTAEGQGTEYWTEPG